MRLALLVAALATPAVVAAQTTVYSQNFESGSAGSAWSGAGSVQTTGGLSAFGFGANHLRNEGQTASLLTLGGLGSHTSMTLSFDLAMWDSIDQDTDIFQVAVDGTFLYNGTFGNYYDACEGPGTLISDEFTGFATPNYGVSAGFRDCARSVSFTFAHSASTAAFSFAFPNTQGTTDESFGLDNVIVRTNRVADPGTVVPEPGTYALVATGLAGLVAVRRRRRA
jgi:hypothetical protein